MFRLTLVLSGISCYVFSYLVDNRKWWNYRSLCCGWQHWSSMFKLTTHHLQLVKEPLVAWMSGDRTARRSRSFVGHFRRLQQQISL